MNFGLLYRTIKHLRPTQVFHQVKYRLRKPAYVALEAPDVDGCNLKTEPIPRWKCYEGNTFTFLNLNHEFAGWGFNEYGNLWTYNQNYFDWLNQEGMTAEEGCKWIDRFIDEILGFKAQSSMSLDPYPIALRCINWVKFFCKFPETATKPKLDALYSQIKLLEKKLEYHLLGNHLLEDAYALFIVACYFQDTKLLDKAQKLLVAQLKEQVLPDGAHYEQSPMYHCILLDRLLDCINIAYGLQLTAYCDKLKAYAIKMLGHLEYVVYADGSIPMLNDSANGIAPLPARLFDYANRLGFEWKSIPMKESGYRKLQSDKMESIVDVGDITAVYQPGHTHADSFNYELRIDGKPFVVDTGISTYNKNERRQYERSTVAHNCVAVNGRNSSEVWGGFRVGKRAKVSGLQLTAYGLEASHNGYGKPCKRKFEMTEQGFTVEDWYDGEATSYVHLAEGAEAKRVKVEGALKVVTKPCEYSTEYNKFLKGSVMEINFKGHCKYTIQ